MPVPSAIAFDAYGTLFDVHSVVALAETRWPGRGAALSQLWRTKQLEYTWLRSLMGRYSDFEQVTAEALAYACEALGLPLDDATRDRFLAEYRRLALFPEVRDALASLAGTRLAILTNGSPAMIEPLVRHAALDGLITDVLSVDTSGIYKPVPRVYHLACERFGLPPAEIGFVSSNGWDAIGAKAFGFRTVWVNRGGAPMDRMGLVPDHVVTSLAELRGVLG